MCIRDRGVVQHGSLSLGKGSVAGVGVGHDGLGLVDQIGEDVYKRQEYTTLVAKEMGFDAEKYDGETMIRLRANGGDISALKMCIRDRVACSSLLFLWFNPPAPHPRGAPARWALRCTGRLRRLRP